MKRLTTTLKTLAMLPIISAMCFSTTTAHAKKDTAEVSGSTLITAEPTFYVKSDGQKYTELSHERHPLMSWQIPARFKYEPGSNDRIKSYHLQLRMHWEHQGQIKKFAGSHVRESYRLGTRPKKVDHNVSFPLGGSEIESFVVDACNTTANGFRNIGQSNDLIFSREHHVSARIYASHAIDTQPVLPATFGTGGYFLNTKPRATIVCMKAPAPTVATAGDLQTSSGVTDTSLTVTEQSTLGGSCKINLSSAIKTNLPNTTVKYRFEHSNGKKSDLKTVKTDHSKTAMDTHWYDVPKNPHGEEAGSIRIIGVSHDFQSDWKPYNMTCNESGPNGLSLVTKPTVQIDLQPTNNVMYQGKLCPTKVKITATLSSKKNFSGTGVVTVKNGQFSFATHDVNLSPSITWRYYETFDLKPWNTINSPVGNAGGSNTWQTQPSSGQTTPSQRFELRYTLSANNKHVIKTPFKTISVSCTSPQVNQHVLPTQSQELNVTPNANSSKQKVNKIKAVPALKLPQPRKAQPQVNKRVITKPALKKQ
ncbi:MAG: hypothetical protein V3U89_09530 [Methylophilaceae bacterium]